MGLANNYTDWGSGADPARLALLAAGLVLEQRLCLLAGLVWVAHIGLDRMLGYGLKYASAFSHTHLGRIGR